MSLLKPSRTWQFKPNTTPNPGEWSPPWLDAALDGGPLTLPRGASKRTLLRRARFGGRKGASARRRLGFKPSTLRAFQEIHTKHLLAMLADPVRREESAAMRTVREIVAILKQTGHWKVLSSSG